MVWCVRRRLASVMLLMLVAAACNGLKFGYQPPIAPIEFELHGDGTISASATGGKYATPIGVFSIGVTEDLVDGADLRAWLSRLISGAAPALAKAPELAEGDAALAFVNRGGPGEKEVQAFLVKPDKGRPLYVRGRDRQPRPVLPGKVTVIDVTGQDPGPVAELVGEETIEKERQTEATSGDQDDGAAARTTVDSSGPEAGGEEEFTPPAPESLPSVTPPDVDFATNTPEPLPTKAGGEGAGEPEATAEAYAEKTLRPTDVPATESPPTVQPVTNTPVPIVTATMQPSPTPACLRLDSVAQPAYPPPPYPGVEPTVACVTTTPVPVFTYTPPPTNTSVPVRKTVRPSETPLPAGTPTPIDSPSATNRPMSPEPPSPTPVPQIPPCATLVAGGSCFQGVPRLGALDARFGEACLVDVDGLPMLRYRLRLENRSATTLQGQAFSRAFAPGNRQALLGGLACVTGWRLDPGEATTLVGLLPLTSRQPVGRSVALELRSRTWSCDPRAPRFLTWSTAAQTCGP